MKYLAFCLRRALVPDHPITMYAAMTIPESAFFTASGNLLFIIGASRIVQFDRNPPDGC